VFGELRASTSTDLNAVNAGAHVSKTTSRQYVVRKGMRGLFDSTVALGVVHDWDTEDVDVVDGGMLPVHHSTYMQCTPPTPRPTKRGICFGREPTVCFTVQVIKCRC
jgi:hypothetical protein